MPRGLVSIRRMLVGAALATLVAACPDSTSPNGAADIEIAGGNGQVATVGTRVPKPLAVKVTDAAGRTLAGITVRWELSRGGGSVASPTSTTDADGIATLDAWTLGKTSGRNSVVASVEGVTKKATLDAFGVAGAPARVAAFGGVNQVAASGTKPPNAPAVKVLDANDNPVRSVAVTFAVDAGGGTLAGPVQLTDASGIAYADWTLGDEGENALTATVTGFAPLRFIAMATAPAARLAIEVQPDDAVSGQRLAPQPEVSIRDAAGNLVTTSAAEVTASLVGGSATLVGTRTVKANNGIARFTDLRVLGTGAVTMAFTTSGLASATSDAFETAAPPPLNLTIEGVHLTQGTQTFGGSVPLVAGRPALARVFARASVDNAVSATVRVRTFVGGTPFRTYTIPAPSSSVPAEIDESNLAWSWNVMIPANEVVVGLSILADVDPQNAVSETSEADNAYPVSGIPLALDVRQVPTMRATFVPIIQPGVAAGNISNANKDQVTNYAWRVFPFDTIETIVREPYTYNAVLNGSSYDASWTTLLNQVAAVRVADRATDRYYYGVAHPAYMSGGTGLGQMNGSVAIGMDFGSPIQPATNYFSMTLAHEWGHNFGRSHVNCGSPSDPDPSYPYDAAFTVGTTGYDIVSGALYGANSYREFMSYCQPVWTSDYTYRGVLTYRQGRSAAPPASSRKSLLVWGRIGPSGVVLEPAYVIDAPPTLPDRPGPYRVEALDESGRELFALSFEGSAIDHAPGERNFAFAVPLEAGPAPVALRLMDGSRELARRTRAGGLTRGGAAANVAATAARAIALPNARTRVEWDARSYPGVMVRDPVTGHVLALLTGGAGEVAIERTEVEVVFSTGVGSVAERVRVMR